MQRASGQNKDKQWVKIEFDERLQGTHKYTEESWQKLSIPPDGAPGAIEGRIKVGSIIAHGAARRWCGK